MVLKLNISNKGKAWKIEVEPSVLEGKSIADIIQGEKVSPDLAGYELKITGGTDFAGFPMTEKVEGIGLKRVLLTRGFGMKDATPGMRRRKTVRGKTIFDKTSQVNIIVEKEGSKKLEEVFPDQNKKEEPAVEAPAEGGEAPKAEEKVDEKKEDKPEDSKEEVKAEEKKEA